MLANFVAINAMHQSDVEGRNGLPLGDANWSGTLVEVDRDHRFRSSPVGLAPSLTMAPALAPDGES